MITQPLGRLKEIIHGNHLAQCLAQSKPSLNVSYAYYLQPSYEVGYTHVIYTLQKKTEAERNYISCKGWPRHSHSSLSANSISYWVRKSMNVEDNALINIWSATYQQVITYLVWWSFFQLNLFSFISISSLYFNLMQKLTVGFFGHHTVSSDWTKVYKTYIYGMMCPEKLWIRQNLPPVPLYLHLVLKLQ